jgi:succinyl-diaminopimelate desuccinylase
MSGPLQAALAAIAAAEATVPADMDAVLRVDTSYPPGRNYAGVVAWAEARLAPFGFRCRRVEVPEPLWNVYGAGAGGARVNLVAEQPGASGEPLGIYAHMDVVPAADGWSVPPFAATRDGEWLLGRGAADMKASIAALMLALEAAHAHAVPLRYAPRVLLCTDEEGGAYPGIRFLAEQGEVPEHLLCLDGGTTPRIWTGAFGSLELLLEVEGIAGHAGQRGSGDNALERAIPMLAALLALKPVVEARVSALRDRAGEPLRPILAITVAQAGVKANSIPDRCRIALNRRYMPEEDDAAVLAEIRAAIAAAAPPGTRWALHITGHLAATAGADDGPHWPRWIAAMAASFGWNPAEALSYGASSSSDMGWVQRARPPGLSREILLGGAIGPESRVHGVDERVRIADIQALAAAILRYLSGDFA